MESPFRVRSNIGTRRSTSEFLPWVIYAWVCALMILSIISACLWSSSDYRMVVTWSIELLLWLEPYTFEKTTNLGFFWAFFRDLRTVHPLGVDGPPFNFSAPPEHLQFAVSEPFLPADGPVFDPGRSAVVSKILHRTLPKLVCFTTLNHGRSASFGRTVRSRIS